MGPILFQAVGTRAPRVHVEGAVLLLGPGVVVLERQVVTIGQPEVELREGRPRVVGAGDRAEVGREHRITGRQERLEGVELGAGRSTLLLDLVIDLLVVRQKEERFVPLDRPAEREAELILRKVGLEPRDGARRGSVLGRARDGVELPEVVQRATHLVGTGLGDHVHESAGRTPELGVGPARDHDELLHRVEVERKRRSLPAALLAEERVVEVRPVHRHVVVDAALARHGELIAIRALHDRHVGREQREVDEVAPVVRQAPDHLLRQRRRRRRLRHIHHRLRRLDRHRSEGDRGERQPQGHRLPDSQRDPRLLDLGIADRADGHIVGAEGEQGPGKVARCICRQRAREVGLRFMQEDRRVGHGRAVGVRHHAADNAGRGLTLGTERRRGAEQRGYGAACRAAVRSNSSIRSCAFSSSSSNLAIRSSSPSFSAARRALIWASAFFSRRRRSTASDQPSESTINLQNAC